MELIAEFSPKCESHTHYIIDRDKLLRLHEAKLIQGKLYVYLAIKTLKATRPSISLCEQWELSEDQLSIAIAQLHKRGALQLVARQFSSQLF